MKRWLSVITLVGLITTLPFPSSTPAAVSSATGRQWITEMKQAPRGPFRRLRWFCKDGTVHPPKPYPCAKRGGGHQHGEWSDRPNNCGRRYLAFTDALLTMEELPIVVSDDGRTEIDDRGKQIRCAMEWQDLAAFEDFVTQRLLQGPVDP